MLIIGNAEFEFSHIGFFTTEEQWIHPSIIQDTHQLIFVTDGVVHICENNEYYDLTKGNVLLLKNNTLHYGYAPSYEPTAFYWMHFRCNNIEALDLPVFTQSLEKSSTFKELLHFQGVSNCSQLTKDSIALYTISQIRLSSVNPLNDINQQRLANEIFEYVRINANPHLTVASVAEHFRYSPEHITRLVKKNFNRNLKDIINSFIIEHANSLLCYSNYSIKEIAANLNFIDTNKFIKFYKYHTNISPSRFRNSYSKTYMNNK